MTFYIYIYIIFKYLPPNNFLQYFNQVYFFFFLGGVGSPELKQCIIHSISREAGILENQQAQDKQRKQRTCQFHGTYLQ